jgi:DNA-binding XRE family transcriptional regulator
VHIFYAYDRASYVRAWTDATSPGHCRGMPDVVAIRKQLGLRGRALRKKRNWSQEDLAHEGGLARSFTGAIERGEKDLRLTTLVKLANTFGIHISQLFK